MRILRAFVPLAALLSIVLARAQPIAPPPLEEPAVPQKRLAASAADGVEWRFERRGRLLVIGDIHGDPDALLAILENAKLLERDGTGLRWTGGADVQLVMMGDLVGKGDRSADVLNLAIDLEAKMRSAGSEFHLVLGNHEGRVLSGDFSALSADDVRRFRKLGKLEDLFSAKGVYGRWLAQRNSLTQIGNLMFCHAGLSDWAEDFPPDQINATVRSWIRHWQGEAPEPPKATRWAVGLAKRKLGIQAGDGPLHTRAFSPRGRANGLSPDQLQAWLDRYQARHLILGHYPTPKSQGPHPHYGDRVWLVDTGISEAVDGRLTYLDLEAGRGPEQLVRVPRPKGAHAFREEGCLKALRWTLHTRPGKPAPGP